MEYEGDIAESGKWCCDNLLRARPCRLCMHYATLKIFGQSTFGKKKVLGLSRVFTKDEVRVCWEFAFAVRDCGDTTVYHELFSDLCLSEWNSLEMRAGGLSQTYYSMYLTAVDCGILVIATATCLIGDPKRMPVCHWCFKHGRSDCDQAQQDRRKTGNWAYASSHSHASSTKHYDCPVQHNY